MSKENISASVDEEVSNYLSQERINTSGLVNRLVKSYMGGAAGEQQMLQLRKDQLETDLDRLESEKESLERQLERIETRLEEINTVNETDLQEAFEALANITVELTPENPAVKTQAEKVGLEPTELIKRFNEHNNKNNS